MIYTTNNCHVAEELLPSELGALTLFWTVQKSKPLNSISSTVAYILVCKRASAMNVMISLEAFTRTLRDKLGPYFLDKTRQHYCTEGRDAVCQSPPIVRCAPDFCKLAASHYLLAICSKQMKTVVLVTASWFPSEVAATGMWKDTYSQYDSAATTWEMVPQWN